MIPFHLFIRNLRRKELSEKVEVEKYDNGEVKNMFTNSISEEIDCKVIMNW